MPCGFCSYSAEVGGKARFLMNKTFHLCDMFHIAKAFNDEDFSGKFYKQQKAIQHDTFQ